MDAILPWLVDLFGGRQSARTIHFIAAGLIVLFVLVHCQGHPRRADQRGPLDDHRHSLSFRRTTSMSRIQPCRPARRFLGLGAAGLGAAAARRLRPALGSPELPALSRRGRGADLSARSGCCGGGQPLAREFAAADLSPDFKVNGTPSPDDDDYAALRETISPTGGCESTAWCARPLALSLADLEGPAAAHPDHPPRLRRGLERDRPVDGRAARRPADRRRLLPSARYASSIAPTCTKQAPTARATTTRAST